MDREANGVDRRPRARVQRIDALDRENAIRKLSVITITPLRPPPGARKAPQLKDFVLPASLRRSRHASFFAFFSCWFRVVRVGLGVRVAAGHSGWAQRGVR